MYSQTYITYFISKSVLCNQKEVDYFTDLCKVEHAQSNCQIIFSYVTLRDLIYHLFKDGNFISN